MSYICLYFSWIFLLCKNSEIGNFPPIPSTLKMSFNCLQFLILTRHFVSFSFLYLCVIFFGFVQYFLLIFECLTIISLDVIFFLFFKYYFGAFVSFGCSQIYPIYQLPGLGHLLGCVRLHLKEQGRKESRSVAAWKSNLTSGWPIPYT